MNIYDDVRSLCDIIKGSDVTNPVVIAVINPENLDCARLMHGDPFALLFMLDKSLHTLADKMELSFNEILNMMKAAHMGGENNGSFPGNL